MSKHDKCTGDTLFFVFLWFSGLVSCWRVKYLPGPLLFFRSSLPLFTQYPCKDGLMGTLGIEPKGKAVQVWLWCFLSFLVAFLPSGSWLSTEYHLARFSPWLLAHVFVTRPFSFLFQLKSSLVDYQAENRSDYPFPFKELLIINGQMSYSFLKEFNLYF